MIFGANLLKYSKIKMNRLVLFSSCSHLCSRRNGCVKMQFYFCINSESKSDTGEYSTLCDRIGEEPGRMWPVVRLKGAPYRCNRQANDITFDRHARFVSYDMGEYITKEKHMMQTQSTRFRHERTHNVVHARFQRTSCELGTSDQLITCRNQLYKKWIAAWYPLNAIGVQHRHILHLHTESLVLYRAASTICVHCVHVFLDQMGKLIARDILRQNM